MTCDDLIRPLSASIIRSARTRLIATDGLLTASECIPHQVGQDAPVHERVAVFVAGHIYVHEHGRPACLPVTHYRDG